MEPELKATAAAAPTWLSTLCTALSKAAFREAALLAVRNRPPPFLAVSLSSGSLMTWSSAKPMA